MKKIERIEQGGSITVVHTEQIDQLESTVEELVERLIDNVKGWEALADSYGCGFVDEDINYLETLTGKTWEDIKKLLEEL